MGVSETVQYDVFVSYSREDVEKASRIVKALEKYGYQVWWDSHLSGGKSFIDGIESAIQNSKSVVILWSESSRASKWVQTEANFAKNKDIAVPVLIEQMEPPFITLNLQNIEMHDWRGGVNDDNFLKLCNAINLCIGREPIDALPAPRQKTTFNLKRASAYAICLLSIFMLAFIVNTYRSVEIDPANLKFGVVLKDRWSIDEAKIVYADIVKRINQGIQKSNDKLQFNEVEIVTYTSVERVKEDIRRGNLHLVGELTPLQIYELNKAVGLVPVVSPNYNNEDTYKAVFFTNKHYYEKFTNAGDCWETIVDSLSAVSDFRIALLNDTSTSGYWYPRYTILQDINGKSNFKDMAVIRNDYESIFESVENNYNGVIAGAIAEFKYCKDKAHEGHEAECRENFPVLGSTGAIPNGGFAISAELHEYLAKNNLLGTLQRSWNNSVAETYAAGLLHENVNGAAAPISLRKYVPRTWTRVNVAHYQGAFEVFEFKN